MLLNIQKNCGEMLKHCKYLSNFAMFTLCDTIYRLVVTYINTA